jgi:hypothetical protein
MEDNIMKRLIPKAALAVPVVIGSVAGIGVGTAGATPVFGGSLAVSFPSVPNTHWVNMEVAPAFGPSNLVNDVYAGSARGCQGCTAMAVSLEVDLVSFTTTPPNETDIARVVDEGSGNDQNLAAAAMFVVTSPGQVNLSASGRAQLNGIESQLRALSLVGSSSALTVQGEISSLLGQVVGILQADVTMSPAQGPPAASVNAAAPSSASSNGVQITSDIQFAS